MKTLFLLLLTATLAFSQEKIKVLKFEGKEYHNVVVKKNVDGVSLFHDSGIKRIDYKVVPPEILKIVGPFDSKKAEQAKQQSQKNEASHSSGVAKVEAAKKLDSSKLEPVKKPEKVKVEAAKDIQRSGKLGAKK
jgi:hypothetical protein